MYIYIYIIHIYFLWHYICGWFILTSSRDVTRMMIRLWRIIPKSPQASALFRLVNNCTSARILFFYCVNILFIFTIYIPDILMENSRSRWVSVKFRWLFYMFFVSLMFQSYGKHSMEKKYSGCFDPTKYLSYIDWIFTGKESKLNIQILSDLFVVESNRRHRTMILECAI